MIEINIKTEGEKVLDTCRKKDITLNEVAIVLLRLKQIEHDLINIEFDSDLEIEE